MEPSENNSTFILPRVVLEQDCDIIDDQDEHIVLTLRLLKQLIRDNRQLLMGLADEALDVATRPGPGKELCVLPVQAFQQDSVILDNQQDHVVLTLRVPKEVIRKNHEMLMALSEFCVA
jgi:hypothetical protein